MSVITRSRRTVQSRKFYQHDYQEVLTDSDNMFGILDSDDDEEKEEEQCQGEVTEEISCVGSGIGGGYHRSSELKVLNYKQATKSVERKEWEVEREKNTKEWISTNSRG